MLTLIIVESLSFTSCHSRSFSAKTESQKLRPNRDSESTAAMSNIWSMSNVKDMVERMFGRVSDSEGETVCSGLLDFFKHEVGCQQMIVLPTSSINTNDEFLEAMPAFLNDFVQLMKTIYSSTIRDDGSSPELLARTSPHEIRWVGGKTKNVAGVAALSLDTAGGSAALPTLYIVCSPDFNLTSNGPQNNILLQFLGKNAWPVGKGVEDEVLEERDHFFHIGRPEFQVGNHNPCPFDMDALEKEAALNRAEFEAFEAEFEAFLTGNNHASSLLVIYSD